MINKYIKELKQEQRHLFNKTRKKNRFRNFIEPRIRKRLSKNQRHKQINLSGNSVGFCCTPTNLVKGENEIKKRAKKLFTIANHDIYDIQGLYLNYFNNCYHMQQQDENILSLILIRNNNNSKAVKRPAIVVEPLSVS